MTNQEWMLTQTPEKVVDTMHWLIEVYGKSYTQSDTAIVEWLSKERR